MALRPELFSKDDQDYLARTEQQEIRDKLKTADAAKSARDLVTANRLNDEAVDLLARGKADDAIAKLRKALDLAPADKGINANYWVAAGNQALRDGHLESVIADLEAALRWNPENQQARAVLERARANRDSQRSAVQSAFSESKSRLLGGRASGAESSPSGPTKAGAFGSREADPYLTPQAAPTAGADTIAGDQLLGAARAATAGADLTVNYDVGGAPRAGSLPTVNPNNLPPRVKNDPRMTEPLHHLGELQTRRTTLQQERDSLISLRNQTKNAAKMAGISQEISAKEQAYQENLEAIAEEETAIVKLHRTISAEIEEPVPGPVAPTAKTEPTSPRLDFLTH
jgi:tetratricopeptide (TPR) repeat protein